MAVIGQVVEAAQRQRRALGIALAGVIEHEVEDDADARLAQRRNRRAQFGDAARRQARIERHEA